MTDITQCPQCGTHYKISQAQRESHQGLVRCGKCKTVFNAVENLYIEPQQLDLPLELDEIADFTGMYAAYDEGAEKNNLVSISPEAAARLANDFSHIPDVYLTGTGIHPAPRHTRLWAVGSAFLVLILLLQIAYFLRVEIAARLPGIKPAMIRTCAVFKCTISLPQKIDLLSIESSELEADTTQVSIITLHALLRSRAPYALAYPHIELTLTDVQDNAIARRNFGPTDYLAPGEDEQRGFPVNRDASIKLHLNTTDLKPAGYRLFLFYPQ